MNEAAYLNELAKCVRCGACKSRCPTYLTVLDETTGARGRITMLGALMGDRLAPSKRLSEKIFECILCGACKGLCPTGIDILETIYHGRIRLKGFYNKGHLLMMAMRLSASRMNSAFFILRGAQKLLYHSLYKLNKFPYIPEIASISFKEASQVYPVRKKFSPSEFSNGVYKGTKRIGRVAIFVGCSVNYFYPHLGDSLLNVLLSKDYEVVVLKGEVCCGSPMRSLGLEAEAIALAKKNVELFSRVKADAILSLCPTCTITIKNEYPLLIGDGIEKMMDVNEFLINNDFYKGLKISPRVVSYHDPCHLNYGLGIRNEPREILKNIDGIEFVEMEDAGDCCGFGGLFSINFKELSQRIGNKKVKSIHNTHIDTLVTSCPGCITQFESIKRQVGFDIDILHIIELIDMAIRGYEV
ncbi:MAG: (Fe-S)-binding protein [Nitrospirae bacterium]|nr:(Fe-S)-binding protein [Nitrospirota bacterium]